MASPSTAPTVTQINGIDAAKFVADLAFTFSSQQDADAAYNAMFFEEAMYFTSYSETEGYFAGGGRGRYILCPLLRRVDCR